MKKIVFLLALFSAFTHANDDVSGFYLGGGFGTTNFDDDEAFDNKNISIDTDSTSIKFIGGYQFNRIVAVELEHTNYGDITITNTTTKKSLIAEPSSISLAANIGYTFDNGWRPFGIAGIGSTKFSTKIQNVSFDDSETSFHYGAGVEYTPKSLGGLAFRIAYEADVFIVDNYDAYFNDYVMTVGTIYAGATYKF